jgi:hypothetical protein
MKSLILINPLIDIIITPIYQAACSMFVNQAHDFSSELHGFKISSKVGKKIGYFTASNSLSNNDDTQKILLIIGHSEEDSFYELAKYQNLDLTNYYVCTYSASSSFSMNHVKSAIEYNIYCSLLEYLSDPNNPDIHFYVNEVMAEILNDELNVSINLPEYKSDFNCHEYSMLQHPYYAFLADKYQTHKKIGITIPFFTDIIHPFHIIIDESGNELIQLEANEEHTQHSIFESYVHAFNHAINEECLSPNFTHEYQQILKSINHSIKVNILSDELERNSNVIDKESRQRCYHAINNISDYIDRIISTDSMSFYKVANRASVKMKSFYEIYFNELHQLLIKSKSTKPTVNVINANVVTCLELSDVGEGCWRVELNTQKPLTYKINMNEWIIDLNYLSDEF